MSFDFDPYMSEIRTDIRKRMNEISDDIALGGMRTFEQYHRHVGQVEGLAIAERMILDGLARLAAAENEH